MAFPKVPICASARAQTVRSETVISTIISAEGNDFYDDFTAATLSLEPDEEAMLTITAGAARRSLNGLASTISDSQFNANSCRRKDVPCQSTTRKGRKKKERRFRYTSTAIKERRRQMKRTPDGKEEGPIATNQFRIRILDGSTFPNIVSENEGFGGELNVWIGGQQGDCANPTTIELQGIRGTQQVKIASTVSSRTGWNRGATTFADAPNVGAERNRNYSDWCGHVNPILTTLPESTNSSCAVRMNPKWKVWLHPNDKLMATARFESRDRQSAMNVALKLYRAPNLESEETTVIAAFLVGRKTKRKRGEFVNKDNTSAWFYLELSRSNKRKVDLYLYEYAIAFEVERSCVDAPKGTFVLPKHDKSCLWLAEQPPDRIESICDSSKSNADINCRQTCNRCSDCFESPSTRIYLRQSKCKSLRKGQLFESEKFERYCQDDVAGSICPVTCDKCPALAGPTLPGTEV